MRRRKGYGGLASAEALARDGARVVIMGRREEALVEASSRIAGAGQIEIFVGDATDEAAVKAALEYSFGLSGRLDILVSVVGEPNFKPILMQSLDDVRQQMSVNFLSAFLLTRHGAPMLPRGGSIVCISSTSATQPSWGLGIYGAAKAALERFVRAAAFELGGAGIRINAVRPGMTLDRERAADPQVAGMVAACAAETPLGRHGEPEDLARVVRFLAGPESDWVTGQSFSADGGMDQGKAPDMMDAIYTKDVMSRVRRGEAMGA